MLRASPIVGIYFLRIGTYLGILLEQNSKEYLIGTNATIGSGT
jgi:hypothetical protein